MDQFKVGFREGLVLDRDRRNWSGDGPRPVRWSAWYPATQSAAEHIVTVPPICPLFVMGKVAPDAGLHEGAERFPVILLSHGTGGTATSLSWFAEGLARAGYVVIGVDHHGNTASEPYRAEGFLCWWERPRDLSLALDTLARDGAFADRLDVTKVACAGFSLGGYTVLSILGGITSVSRFRDWAGASAFGRGPREFPDLVDQIEPLLRDSVVFRSSWEGQSASRVDHRVRSAVALAPAPTVRAFDSDSLAAIITPVTIMVGEADGEAPAESCSVWLDSKLPNSQLHLLGRDVGHYTLLCVGTGEGQRLKPEIYADMPGVDRNEVHRKAIGIALSAVSADIPVSCERPL